MIRRYLLLILLGISASGCTAAVANSTATELKALADAMTERHWSHCVYMQAAVPPFGHMTVLAGSGDWDCVAVWERAGRPPL